MNILKVTLKRSLLLALGLLFGVSTIAIAQKNTTVLVNTRFSHPQYDASAKTWSIDIEMKTKAVAQELFGVNLRFFYDASMLEFVSLSNLHPSYQILGNPLQAYKGNANSGSDMFNFEASAAYINGAIQLAQPDAPLSILPTQWTKVGTLNFSVLNTIDPDTRVCPSLIWDVQQDPNRGGFFTGDNGVVITVVENDPATRQTSAPANVQVEPFNWEYEASDVMPYGNPLFENCFTVSGGTTFIPEITDIRGYALYQNYPNPFADYTVIEFELPNAQQARLAFFDVTGKLIHTVQGDYKSGKNAVKIQRGAWPTKAGLLMYRLETDDFTSGVLKMTVMDR